MRIGSIISRSPWAILESKLEDIMAVVSRHDAGVSLTAEEIAAVLESRAEASAVRASGSIAVIPIAGVIAPKMNLLTDMSGGTSIDKLSKAFRSALADPDVSAILFDVNSPGGSVEGVPELAADILAARGRKPMVAVANYLMASAAYWLAASADSIVASPSASVGSVGVLTVHTDVSEALAKEGIKKTIYRRGAYKAEGNQFEPMDESAQAHVGEALDQMYASFVGHLEQARALTVSAEARTAQTAFGGGRMFLGQDAVTRGLADRVATMDTVIGELLGLRPAVPARGRAEVDVAQARLRLARA